MEKKRKEEKPVCYPSKRWPLDTNMLIQSDTLGSYTGLPVEYMDTPVQDADDL